MSARLKRNIPILKRLHKASKQKRLKLIKDATDDTIDCLCDCAYNVLKGNVPLTTKQYASLKPYRKQLRAVATKSTSLKAQNKNRNKKRKTFQTGGVLLKLLGSLAKSVLGGFLNNN